MTLDHYLVHAHQQDLLRAACTRRPDRCAETRRNPARRSWRLTRAA